MRAFVAIPLPEQLREELAGYAAGAVVSFGGRAVPAENLHVTIHFLGSVHDSDEEALRAALTPACASIAPFSMSVAAAALAPPSRPRMIWAQLEVPSELADLAHAVAASAEPFAPRARPPRTGSPHVTLARFRRRPPRGAELSPLEAAGTEIAVAACELVRSHLGPSGSQYTTVAALPLGRPRGV